MRVSTGMRASAAARRAARPALLFAGLLLTPPVAVAREAVRVGLDKLEADGGRPLRGRRVGLVAHAASVDAEGRHAIDVLRASGIALVRLFAPEHGLRGRGAAGEAQPDGRDEQSGLPVVSLYGPRTRPSPHDLEGLDVLVVDLQDAGVRFYTYASTMLLCLDAAAEAGIELVLLDRPNPLGGERLEGPEADARDVPPSPLRGTPGPLVHGLTLGEMARFVNTRRARPARLTVVPMEGWTREMTWPDTGRDWVAPSPNLRTAEAALAYPGTCLLEATNVSEGRGTEAPFLLFGAPWMEAEALRAQLDLPGFAFAPLRFTPRASPAAPDPRYRDEGCRGLRIRVADGRTARPYAMGIALLAALRRLQPERLRWRDDGLALDRLLATTSVRRSLERGQKAETILAADTAAIEAFRRERASVLLYGRDLRGP